MREKRQVYLKHWLKRRKNLGFYETVFAKLRLGDDYNEKTYLRMALKNLEEIFQLIKDDITRENKKMREPVPS